MRSRHFTDRLFQAVEEKQSRVVVGLDPRPSLMPATVIENSLRRCGHTPEAMAEAIVDFNKDIIDAVADLAVAVKCQIAFYECYGVAGLKAYKRTLDLAADNDLIVIGDVKRNDIGTTAEAYAKAHLGVHAQADPCTAADFHADAITVNPLFGVDGVGPFIEHASRSNGGVFILIRTSNPSSGQLQDLMCEGRPFYQHVASFVKKWGEDLVGDCGYSLVGGVVGATFPEQLKDLRNDLIHTPFLIPGFGAQGAGAEDVKDGFDRCGGGAVVSSSRALIYAFRDRRYANRYNELTFKDAARRATDDMRSELEGAIRK